MRKRGLVKDLRLRNNRRPRRKNRGRRVFIGQFFSLLRSWRQANFASFYARHPAPDEFSAFSRSTFRINCLWQMYFKRSMKSYFTFSHEFDYFLHSWEFLLLQVALLTFLFIPFSSKWYLRVTMLLRRNKSGRLLLNLFNEQLDNFIHRPTYKEMRFYLEEKRSWHSYVLYTRLFTLFREFNSSISQFNDSIKIVSLVRPGKQQNSKKLGFRKKRYDKGQCDLSIDDV